MTNKEKEQILKRLRKAEFLICKGESDLSCLFKYIQPLFDQEVFVTWSNDGATVVDSNGIVGYFAELLNELP